LDSTGILNVVLSNPVRAYSTNYYAHIVDSTGNNAKLKILLNETPKLLPGKNKYNLSGYINTTKDSNVVIGDQTSFLSELRIGDILRSNVDNIVGVVFKIESDTSLILESACAYSLRRRLAHVVERTIVGFDIDMPGSGYSEDAYLKLVDVDASKFDRVYSQSQNPYFLTDYTKYIDEEDMCFVGDYNESSYFSQSYSIHYPIPNADLIVDKCQYNELGTLAHSITTYDYIPRKSDPFSKENAIIKFNVGPVAKYPGHYQNTTGMLSNYSVLYDGKYYQDYSYVIRSNIRQDRYAPYIRKTIHPSGFAMFSERLLESNLSALDPLYGKMWGDYCVDEYTRSERVCVSDFVKVNE
jgi:hypothetical protein